MKKEEQKPELDLKKQMESKAIEVAKKYHSSRYKDTDELLIDVIEIGIQELQGVFSDEYSRIVIRSVFPALVVKRI